MDLTLSPAEQRFRDDLRAWIADNHPGREREGDEEAFAFRRDHAEANAHAFGDARRHREQVADILL